MFSLIRSLLVESSGPIDRAQRADARELIDSWTNDSDYYRTAAGLGAHQHDFEMAALLWPYKAMNRKLYRGLSFEKTEDFEAFKKTTNLKKIKDEFWSSWTPDLEQARAFAMLDDEYGKSGTGIVIAVKGIPGGINARRAIEDANNEVILPPGDYDFTVIEQGEIK